MHSHTKRVSEDGFSLIELMIVMIVMMVVLGAVFTLMKSSINISNATYELTETRENLRIAHEFMNRDVITAGDGLNGINSIQVTQGFVTNYLARNMVADPTRPGYVNLPVISSDADVPGSTVVNGAAPAVNVLGGTDRITILTADPVFTPAITVGIGTITAWGATITMTSANGNRLAVGEIYCFTSQTGAAFGRITGITTVGPTSTVNLVAAGSLGINQPGATGPIHLVGAGNGAGTSTQSVSMMRVKMIHYYVNARKELVKRVYGVAGAGFTDNLVTEHIIGLSFRYVLGLTNPNGTVQQPVRQMTTSAQQIAVRQVEIKIIGETTRPTNFQRNTRAQDEMITTASIRNLQFRQAQ